jgi:hypothetical protein
MWLIGRGCHVCLSVARLTFTGVAMMLLKVFHCSLEQTKHWPTNSVVHSQHGNSTVQCYFVSHGMIPVGQLEQ